MRDMVDACDEALSFGAGFDADTLRADTMRLRALERSLSIIGEAAKRVALAQRAAHADVPWREAAGLRDVFVHDYFGIDVDVFVKVIADELPQMRAALLAAIASEEKSS